MVFFIIMGENILKFIWKHRRHRFTKALLSRKNEAGIIRQTDFRIFYKAIEIKTVQHWHKHSDIGQWNWIDGIQIKPTLIEMADFLWVYKWQTLWATNGGFFKDWCWENWVSVYKLKSETRPLALTLCKNDLKFKHKNQIYDAIRW